MQIIVRKENDGLIVIHPSEEYVDFLFQPLLNAGYSIFNRLTRHSGSPESGYEGYLQIQLKNEQTISTLVNEIRKSSKVISTVEETDYGFKIIF
ncbi:hypothetical protein J1TS5_03250 [Paenibacillus macerans]|uniref:hypothetical protein n=1 Tax=Paenibacillus macerans TaxID=44252 RepID=UPI001B2A66A0|nr:hypothetical protein [Paenibacillus macerans]GIP08155.1 hypothetical protein J1TS5_03250 [Paenibacillus macerans]